MVWLTPTTFSTPDLGVVLGNGNDALKQSIVNASNIVFDPAVNGSAERVVRIEQASRAG